MPDWSIKIVSDPSGGPAAFVPDLKGAQPGQPLVATDDDLITWNNTTNEPHWPWPADEKFAPLPDEMWFGHRDIASARRAVSIIYNTVEKIRNTRTDSEISATEKVRVRIDSDDPVLRSEAPIVARLANMEEVIIEKSTGYSGYSGYSAAGLIIIERANVDTVAERERLDRQIAKAEEQLATTQRKLNNKPFIDRAPAEVVEEHRQRERDFSAQLAKLKQVRESLK